MAGLVSIVVLVREVINPSDAYLNVRLLVAGTGKRTSNRHPNNRLQMCQNRCKLLRDHHTN